MSEHEKQIQIGKLAEEVSRLRGELNHINEKLQRANSAYVRMQQSGGFTTWKVVDGKLVIPINNQYKPAFEAEGLLNAHQLIEILEEKQKLDKELAETTERLKGLAPHLF